VSRYRICRNEAPHQDAWWTVEIEVPRLWFWKRWLPVKQYYGGRFSKVRRFTRPETAQVWIDEDRKPRIHECGDPQ